MIIPSNFGNNDGNDAGKNEANDKRDSDRKITIYKTAVEEAYNGQSSITTINAVSSWEMYNVIV